MSNRSLSVCMLLAACCFAEATAPSALAAANEVRPLLNLTPVPFTQVHIRDAFWAPRRDTNRKVSVPHSFDMLEKAGNIRNLELAAAGAHEGFSGPVFMDSDLYKAIESASYVLATDPDPVLAKRVDDVIAKIAAAQRPDGYLDTYFEVVEPNKRWTNLRDAHELYCAGHLFEAAVAHYLATGKKTLLNVATKYADYIASIFGDGPGKRMGYPGHPEIELALVKLWRVTGQQRYFDLARFLVENRGRGFFAQEHGIPLDKYDGTYWQDNVPIREHTAIVGHAVRAAYLMSGVVDVAAQTHDEGLLRMVDRVWRNTTQKRMYVTGGIGPSASNEGFTTDYDLPNLTAYQETCASVAMAMWNHRLGLLYGDSRYVDYVELALYNGVLAGVSLDGKRFFYVNPLASRGTHHRSEWFGCACCPPNVTRTLAFLGGYAYATSPNGLWVNLYIQGDATANVAGRDVKLSVKTDYPWDGTVTLTPHLASPAKFELRLRVPGWCSGASVSVNGRRVSRPKIERGYFVLDRTWQSGDSVVLNLPMPVQRIEANPNVQEDRGLVALKRGPIVYCLEGCDQSEPLDQMGIPLTAKIEAVRRPDLLGGVVVLKGDATVASDANWSGVLYRPVAPPRKVQFTAVPYYAWDNREPGPMRVWMPTVPPPPLAGGLHRMARVSISFQSDNCTPQAINDGVEPRNSGDHPGALCHWWPHKGGTEWVQYTWTKPVTVSSASVYWFDDTGRGECRLPASWEIQYLDGSEWKPVAAKGGYPVKLDGWCSVEFAPVTTPALRLVVAMQPRWAAGVHEWRVAGPDD